MSMSYCLYCLEQYPSLSDDDEPTGCTQHGHDLIFGELRVAYMRGYRDSEAGLEPQI